MNSHKSKSIYLFFFLSFIGYSQGDQRARALLDQVSEVYASYDTMQMRFSYQLDNTSEGISQKEEGEILVAKDKYNLTILGIQQELAEHLLEKEVIFKDDLVSIFGKRPFEKEETVEEKDKISPSKKAAKST